ncbi:MAG TPA: serine hydrolase domain-containing protein [Streptosporangiaceae bacterium]
MIQRSSGGAGPPTPIENATAGLAPPGLAAAVVSTDGAAEIVTSGLADVRTLRPVTAHTTFLWFSMTKIVTATAVMMLADRGALDLDAPVAGHVPGLRVLRGPGSAITARHLLSHSSGLANPPPVRWVRPAGAPPPDATVFLDRLLHRHRRLRFRPGEKASYSNLGYLVLGELITSCAGQPFCEFVRSELLEPLGMSRTGFEHAQAPADAATGYWRLPPGGRAALRLMLPPGIVGPHTRGLVSFRPFYVNGPPYGGLVGDVHDAARFLALHLGGGAAFGQRLLSAESAIAMRTLTTKGRRLTTGLGWWRRHEPDDAGGLVEHLGGGGAYRNLMRLYPASGQAVVMFGNLTRYPVEDLARTVLAAGSAVP